MQDGPMKYTDTFTFLLPIKSKIKLSFSLADGNNISHTAFYTISFYTKRAIMYFCIFFLCVLPFYFTALCAFMQFILLLLLSNSNTVLVSDTLTNIKNEAARIQSKFQNPYI